MLDTSKQTWSHVDAFTVNPGASANKSYPNASGMTLKAAIHFVNDQPIDQGAYAPAVSISGTDVFVSGGNQTTVIFVVGQ